MNVPAAEEIAAPGGFPGGFPVSFNSQLYAYDYIHDKTIIRLHLVHSLQVNILRRSTRILISNLRVQDCLVGTLKKCSIKAFMHSSPWRCPLPARWCFAWHDHCSFLEVLTTSPHQMRGLCCEREADRVLLSQAYAPKLALAAARSYDVVAAPPKVLASGVEVDTWM